ncbi:MFS transporter [Rhodococcus sp. NPDC057529]|uniref:MFS transporter n=1 Tax=Rhodococcus sp. NPDC057529 TaxID=3346158 RepID=UPI00366F6BD4
MPKTGSPAATATPVTLRDVRYATIIAFLAWTFAVYDFILFGMLLPEIGKSVGLDEAGQAQMATFVALGSVVVALGVGPIVDRFGRRFGMVFTVGGAGVASALTALAGMISPALLVGIRSVSGLGYAEQGVNGTYLSELYSSCDNEKLAKRRGLVYSLVQGGWPIGALLAAGLTAVLLPIIGWEGCFVFAAIPSLIVALAATRLRESPQFEALRKARAARSTVKVETASTHGGLRAALQGRARRTSLVLGTSHILNWFPTQVFSVLGTTILVNVHGISFGNSLVILLLSNSVAYAGYLVHGFLGDRFGRRNVIAAGWVIGGLVLTAMLYGPSNVVIVVAMYSIGQFFLIGPYSCLLFFVGESYDDAVRGSGASFVTGIGPIGAVLASAGATAILGAGGHWQIAALIFGAIPCVLSGLMVLASRDVRPGRDTASVAADTGDTEDQVACPAQ